MLALFVLTAAWAGEIATHATSHRLDNGLLVVLSEDHRADQVALHIRYGIGSGDEPDGLHGCAHLFEHLMFEGSKSVPNNKFDEWLTSGGGWNNAFTNTDQTAYHMAFPSGALDLALFLESDRLGFLDAGLDQANLTNQQGVVLQERYQGFDEPHGRDWEAINRLVFPAGHPYHVSTIGTVGDVNGFTVEGVREFWKKYYRSRNGALVLVGHFDSAVALERLKLWFADVPDAGPAPARFSAAPAQSTPQRGVIEDKVEDRTIYLAWPTVELKHADMPALDLLSWVLSKGRGTRLDDALYYDKPLADSEGAWTFNGAAGGMFVVEATSVRTPLTKLEAAARKVIAGLITMPPTADELLRAKKALRQYYEDQLQDPVSAAELLADCAFEWGDPNCAAARVAAYEAVTPNDLVRVTQTWLLSREPHRLSVVPQGDTGAIAGSSPVEIP